MSSLLTKNEAKDLVELYIKNGGEIVSTQEILDSNAVPRLKGYIVRPGKVSDSIFEGEGSYIDKNTKEKVEFENPPLSTQDGTPLRLMVRTEKISTHDRERGTIPFKDQILATNHNYMRRMLQDTIGTSQFEVPRLGDNSVVIAAENLTQIPFENVLRAYMAKSSTSTSLYQHFMNGERKFCGHNLPENLIPNGILPYIMDTPSTKTENDESVSPENLFIRGLCTRQQYNQIRNSSLVSYGISALFLLQKGLILVDRKTEHGINKKGVIVSQDEIDTMDSSRWWLLNNYNEQLEKLARGEITELKPTPYSKEFAREYSDGKKGYTEEQRIAIAVRYIEGIQHLTGERFEPDMSPREERIINGLEIAVNTLVD